MKNVLVLLIAILIVSCNSSKNLGVNVQSQSNIVKVNIGAASTKKNIDVLVKDLKKQDIGLEINELQYNKKGEISRIAISVNSGLGHAGKASLGNLNSSEAISPIKFIVDKNKNSRMPFCIGNCDTK